MRKTARTTTLEIAYLEFGPPDGPPVILLHGWPSDPHDYDNVAPRLAETGCRVLTPWLRGYGATHFLDPATPRSGQQAALGADLRDFMDALGIGQAVLGGYDWGGRAACVVAALWPDRVRGLVSITGYNIQNIPASAQPASATTELRYWYQWYMQTERGRAGMQANRRDLARLLWRLWSPNWQFDDATFARTADSFDNPDFVDVTIQSYRHRFANAAGDPAYEASEAALAAQPPISVPTIVLHGEADGVTPPETSAHVAHHFTARYERRVIPIAGHFLSRETPEPVVQAVRDLLT
ncbi:MAG TPA: alpha/beta hydrolase [Acetobacteraceae bacterium]|jgi:pimeloyl-ACP methyl ester carboxylesterase|nr:alpha/beta hydrolase [Acetobacteraceae bacterium]